MDNKPSQQNIIPPVTNINVATNIQQKILQYVSAKPAVEP
jgi:hypothetical protein